jgi:hypothetical protein
LVVELRIIFMAGLAAGGGGAAIIVLGRLMA